MFLRHTHMRYMGTSGCYSSMFLSEPDKTGQGQPLYCRSLLGKRNARRFYRHYSTPCVVARINIIFSQNTLLRSLFGLSRRIYQQIAQFLPRRDLVPLTRRCQVQDSGNASGLYSSCAIPSALSMAAACCQEQIAFHAAGQSPCSSVHRPSGRFLHPLRRYGVRNGLPA